MVFSTSSAEILDQELDLSPRQALFKHLMYAIVGSGLAYGIGRAGVQRLIRWSPLLLAFFTFLLVLVLVPGIGREVNGSKRWLHLFGFSFQPSEFVKYLVPLFVIHRLQGQNLAEMSLKAFLKLVAIAAVPLLLIVIEPNNGTTGVIGMTTLVVFLLMGVPSRYWAIPLLVGAVAASLFAYQSNYVRGRLNVYLHPELDLRGKGHQPYQAKIAAGSGQLWGKGVGNSLQKLSYLPEAQNDYIAAIFAEEFGFSGIVILLSLYMTLISTGFLLAFACPDRNGAIVGGFIAFLFGFQAFMNLGVVSGLLPSTGLNLPLFSQGGTSLMANLAGLTLLFQATQTGFQTEGGPPHDRSCPQYIR